MTNEEFARTPRIIGTEMEYANDTKEHARSKLRTVSGVSRQGQFLSNGARNYYDVNSVLEYATPECLGPH